MTTKSTKIIRRINRLERRALYEGMSPATERAMNRYWRAFHNSVVGG